MGIPYAEPPVDDLRWKAPVPSQNWQGTYMAIEPGPACSQFTSIITSTSVEKNDALMGSEDCLYLNICAPIFTPDNVPEGNSRLPVMIWIHGGGNTTGQGGVHHGKILAEKYNVIMVTFNYRLGPFGWFAHPALRVEDGTDEERTGNYGTLDIIRTLVWVQENIENFGGDPLNVTLFGNSEGAINILSLLISPKAKGLFHKTIMQSGGIFLSTMAEAENYMDDVVIPGHSFSSREVINHLLIADNIASDRDEAKTIQEHMSDKEIADYLYSKTSFELLDIYKPDYSSTVTMPLVFQDGAVLPKGDVMEILKDASKYNAVPTILGSNRDERKSLMIADPEYVDLAFGFFPIHIKDRPCYGLLASYLSDEWKADGVDAIATILRETQGPEVYAYRFDWDEEGTIFTADLSFALGTCHGLEVPFVFNNFDSFFSFSSLMDFVFPEECIPGRNALSDNMSSYWAEFAYSGSPGRGRDAAQINWEPWDNASSTSDKFIILDTEKDGGIHMSSSIVTLYSLKYRLLAETGFPTQEQHCKTYVQLFKETDLWNDDEYQNLGKEGCSDYPVEE